MQVLQGCLVVLIVVAGQPGWASADRGQALYQLCAACHGNQGEGHISVGAPAIAGLPQWYIATQLQKFRHGARGRHPRDAAGLRMRPMALSLPSESDVQVVAHYVATLPPQAPPQTFTGNLTNGAQQY